MSHNLETRNGRVSMAYAGETPWHTLGKPVPADLTPLQMLEAADLAWQVSKVPAYATINHKRVNIGWSALERNVDHHIIDVVSNDWNPVQNLEACEFFNDYVMQGDMEMHTAGSLQDGQIVWFLAKVKESFELFKGDRIDSYLLFSNFHKYGFSTDVRFTPIRVVCNNTLSLSLGSKVEKMAKISHRRTFSGEEVKTILGISSDKLSKYKEMAQFLGSKRYTDEKLFEYFTRIFPVTGTNEVKKKDASKTASLALDVIHTQPGAKFAEGTWWQPYNTVTYITDHLACKTADTRLTSAWYGSNKTLKTKALELAVEMAEAA
jgi:phage/plasmid-like protein (TIGR03299 family)